jgi:hypothetical protein
MGRGVDVSSHTRRLKTRYVKVKSHDRSYPHCPPVGELGALILVPTLAVACTLGVSWFIVKNTAKLAGKAVGTLAPKETVRKELPEASCISLIICLVICPLIIAAATYFGDGRLFRPNNGRLFAPQKQDVQENVKTYQTTDEYMADMQKAVDKMLAE